MAAQANLTEDDTDVTGQIPMPQNAAGHTLSFVEQNGIPGQYGTFSVDANGVYSYQLNNTLLSVQGLGEGQSLTETFTYTVSDGAGGTTSNTVTITINGLNDAPTVDSAATSILEDQDHTTGILPTPQDIDADDSPQYLTQTNSAGQYGYLSLNADGTYTYTLDNSLPIVQRLGSGDFLTETFTYTVDDGHGGTASGNLVITIHGTNDVPTVSAATASVDEDGPVLMGVLPTPHDVDAGDVPQFVPQTGSVGAYGVLTVDAQGNYSYVLDNSRPEIQALSQGDTLTEQFIFTVTDGQSYVSKTLTITINGTNDAPTVGTASASIGEEAAGPANALSGLLPTPYDADIRDTVSFVPQTNRAGTWGTLTLRADGTYTYALTDSAAYTLASGETEPNACLYAKCDLTINGTGSLRETVAEADSGDVIDLTHVTCSGITLPSQQQTIVLAMDVSGSMRATDVEPDRLTAAQNAAKAFIAELPRHVRVGIVAFAGSAQLAQLPTQSHEDLVKAIDSFQLQRGTATGNGIMLALATLFPDAGIDIAALGGRQAMRIAGLLLLGGDIGGGVQVMPGVTIGSNVVIGGGSVVVKDIPSDSVAVGNPCRVIRPITEADKQTCWDR